MAHLKGNQAKARRTKSCFSIAGDMQPMPGSLNAALQKFNYFWRFLRENKYAVWHFVPVDSQMDQVRRI
jgi:hypothetical protein